MLAFDRPNTLIVQDPFVMVPAFFVPLSWVIAAASAGVLLPAWYYFLNHTATQRTPALAGVN